MKVTVVSVGKIKEMFYSHAIAEYAKRLGRYCTLSMIEIPDEKAPESLSLSDMRAVKDREGNRILDKIPQGSFVITLEIDGKQKTSEELAENFEQLALNGTSHICFIIGGSLGIGDAVKTASNLSLSFSKMTFPHQLFKVMLLEQVYRAFRIIRGEPYHK